MGQIGSARGRCRPRMRRAWVGEGPHRFTCWRPRRSHRPAGTVPRASLQTRRSRLSAMRWIRSATPPGVLAPGMSILSEKGFARSPGRSPAPPRPCPCPARGRVLRRQRKPIAVGRPRFGKKRRSIISSGQPVSSLGHRKPEREHRASRAVLGPNLTPVAFEYRSRDRKSQARP